MTAGNSRLLPSLQVDAPGGPSFRALCGRMGIMDASATGLPQLRKQKRSTRFAIFLDPFGHRLPGTEPGDF